MKRSILFVVALVAGAALSNALLPENGYVALSFRGYLVEMSVPTLVLCLVLTLVLLAAAQRLWRWPGEQRARRLSAQRERAQADLTAGLLEMSAGRWNESELTLTRHARDARCPAVHYLAAARAADLQGAQDRRETWLSLARDAAVDEHTPVLITIAEMSLKSGRTDAALEALGELEGHGDLNPRALLLLARACRQRGDFDRLRQLESRLRSTRGIAAGAVDEIMDTLYADMLKVATDRGSLGALNAVWDDATRAARRRPAVRVAYARGLARFDQPEQAATVLHEALEAEWSDAAAQLYGKARSYLETSQALRPRADTAQLLAAFLEQLGEHDRAVALLKSALVLVTGQQPGVGRLPQRRPGVPRR